LAGRYDGDANSSLGGRAQVAYLRSGGTLQDDLGLKAFDVAENRGDSEHASIKFEPQETVLAGDVAVDRDFVPLLGVTDIVDRNVVMLTPEKRHGGERRAIAEHVERSGLPLTLSHNPVLDADVLT